MNVYPIGEALEHKYKGAGYAVAAFSPETGELVSFVYASELAPHLHDFFSTGGMIGDKALLGWFQSHTPMHPALRELQALGVLKLGTLSCREFCELF